MAVKSGYLSTLFTPKLFKERLDQAVAVLTPINDKFDAIAITGSSGTIFGGALSLALNKPLILVRKPETSCHSESLVEGDTNVKTYIFVDDLSCGRFYFK